MITEALNKWDTRRLETQQEVFGDLIGKILVHKNKFDTPLYYIYEIGMVQLLAITVYKNKVYTSFGESKIGFKFLHEYRIASNKAIFNNIPKESMDLIHRIAELIT